MVYLNDDITHFDWQAALPLLSAQRREYGIQEPPVFEYGEHGKPAIQGHPDIHFNLSHCRQAAICVVSPQPVGVDIESPREYKESLARYTMNDREMASILQSDSPALEFTRLWTRKEAVVKLSGRGITDNLKHVLEGYPYEIQTTVCEAKNYVYSIANLKQ